MVVQKINSKNINSKIAVIKVAAPKKVSYKIKKSIKKSIYLTTAKNIANYMNSNKKAPSYVRVGKYKAKYTVYTYSFANILTYYVNYKKLPSYCKFKG